MPEYKFTFNDFSEEMMLQHPSGRIQFMGFWASFKLAFLLVREGKVVYLNDVKISK